jgi:hypothetical protein
MAICTAVAIAEQSAESVSIRRHQPITPPTQNVNLAASRELPACHFGGSIAKSAKVANFVQIANHTQLTLTLRVLGLLSFRIQDATDDIDIRVGQIEVEVESRLMVERSSEVNDALTSVCHRLGQRKATG